MKMQKTRAAMLRCAHCGKYDTSTRDAKGQPQCGVCKARAGRERAANRWKAGA